MKKLVLSLALFLILSSASFAQEKLVHVVISGETLFSISRALNVSVSELQSWNNLSSDALAIGQELLYFKTSNEPVRNQESGESLIQFSASSENEFYIVKSGDNLTSIAKFHDMSINELRTLNNISGDLIRIGQQLVVRKARIVSAISFRIFLYETPQGSFVIHPLNRMIILIRYSVSLK